MDNQAIRFLGLLGRRPEGARLRAFPYKHSKRKGEIRARKGGWDLDKAAQWNREGRGIYLVVNEGGDTKASITRCVAFFVEWDDRPIDWQVSAWRELGLPEPSIIVSTGNSAHTYWVLREGISPDEWRPIQTRLIEFCGSDPACKDESRVMRLPGFDYIGEDDKPTHKVEILHESDNRYCVGDLTSIVDSPTLEDLIGPQPSAPPAPRAGSNYPPSTIEDIREALWCVPRRVPGGNTYPEYRNLLCGLAATLAEIGESEESAIALMEEHSPSAECGWDIRQTMGSMATRKPEWFWGICRDHGYRRKRANRREGLKRGTGGGGVGDGELRSAHDSGPAKWDAFTILGFDRGTYFYHPEASGQITDLQANSHTSNNLFKVAPLQWWKDRWPRYNKEGELVGVAWAAVASDLLEAQHKVGIFDPWRVRGAGVWMDGGKPVMHLGDRLVIDRKEVDVRQGPPGTEYIYDKTKAIKGPNGAKPMTDDEGLCILMLASRFNWEEPSGGILLSGWVFLAPICGALDWRPHIWLTAAAGSGKSTVLERFVLVLLGDFACVPIGGSTEPGIRQELASAARPVVFDEAESNDDSDKTRMAKVIDAARASSSKGKGKVMKGTISGSGMAFALRSMWLLCSIATALNNAADKTRFAVLTLIKATEKMSAEEATAQWKEINNDLAAIVTPEAGQRMIARAFSMVEVIRAAVPVFSAACAVHLGTQRLGDQYGTLCAGAWCLVNSRVPTEQEAANWLRDYPLVRSAEESQSEPDERVLYETIMQHHIRVEIPGSGSQTQTVREVAMAACRPAVDRGLGMAPGQGELLDCDEAQRLLGRHGMKVAPGGVIAPDGRQTGAMLLVATSSRSVKTLLQRTPWAACWSRVLGRLHGAVRTGNARFHGAGVSKAIAVPLELEEQAENA